MNQILTPIKSYKKRPPKNPYRKAEYEQFVIFCATPQRYRELKTQDEFAERFGLSIDTLTDWKKMDGFWEKVAQVRRGLFREKTSEAIHALLGKILKDGTAPETKLFLQYVEGWDENMPMGGDGGDKEIPREEYLLIKRVFGENVLKKRGIKISQKL